MKLIHYDENFNPIEVEVDDFVYKINEAIRTEGLINYELSPDVTSPGGDKMYISVLRPGRQLGEDGEYYQITIEKVND